MTERLPKEVCQAIQDFIIDEDRLYENRETLPGTLTDPAEDMDFCIICDAQEREHTKECLLYPLWMAI